jgi:hypothetical protein
MHRRRKPDTVYLPLPSGRKGGEETMSVAKIARTQVTQAIEAMKRSARGDDEAAAVAQTREILHLAGPDAATLLHHAIVSDSFASPAQRVRSAVAVLDGGGFMSYETRSTGLFREPEASEDGNEREAG